MQAAVPGCFVKRWWGRGAQKSPPETFVRGLAVPLCSTPVTMPKKDPKKLCAFWGLISVPVVGVEPTRCHHQRILSPSRLPIPTHRLICCLYSILQACQKIKIYFALIFTPQIRSKSNLTFPALLGTAFSRRCFPLSRRYFSRRSVRQRSAWQSLLCGKSSA